MSAKESANRALPSLAVLGSILSLTIGTSFGKQLFPIVGAAGTTCLRVTFAALMLLSVCRPWRYPLNRQQLFAILRYGIVLGLMNLMFYQALDRLPLGIAIAIEFTGPLAIAVGSSRRKIDFLWIVLTVIGLALILPLTHATQSLDSLGICFAFASAFLWALYIIVGKDLANVPAAQSISLGMSTAACVVLPSALFLNGPAMLQPELLLPGLGLALASSAVPYSLEMYALKRLPKNTFGILLSMEPAVGALSGFFVLHEHLSLQQCIAIACIMSASVGTAFQTSAPQAEPKAADVPADIL